LPPEQPEQPPEERGGAMWGDFGMSDPAKEWRQADMSLVVLVDLHPGQGTSAVEAKTSSSNCWPQSSQVYSWMGMFYISLFE
jgi:hypothetical protein